MGTGSAWDDLAGWWRNELETDPAYADEVDPLFWELFPDGVGSALDIGCGDGRVMAQVDKKGVGVTGVDGSAELLADAERFGAVHRVDLPRLDPVADDSFDLAYAVLVLEHLPAIGGLFSEVARAVTDDGWFVTVVNHPLSTSPGSAPVVDPIDGEVLWRVGEYLSNGWHDEPAGERSLRFHHRPMGVLLSEAARHGLSLELMIEQGPPQESIDRIPLLDMQRHIPRLLGLRWRVGALHSVEHG